MLNFSTRLLRIVAAGFVVSVPAVAQHPVSPMPAPAKDYGALSDKALQREIEAVTEDSPQCAVQLPLMAALIERIPAQPGAETARRQAETARTLATILCDIERHDFVSALGGFQNARQSLADLSPAFGLYLAVVANDTAATSAYLLETLSAPTPEERARVTKELVWDAGRTLHRAGMSDELETIYYRVARGGDTAEYEPALRETISTGALAHALKRGEADFASVQFDHIVNPRTLLSILADRTYAPVWSIAENRAGANLRTVTAAYRGIQQERRKAAPGEPERLNDLAHALYFDGDFAGVIAAVDVALDRPNLFETLVEDEAWALNLQAYAFDAIGQRERADAVFERLAGLNPQGNGWLVNFVINRASRLVGQQRWREGLAASELAARIAEDTGSTFAKMLIARDRICALNALGRPSEFEADLAYLDANSGEAPDVAAVGLLCLDRSDEAAAIMLAALADKRGRDRAIAGLQPGEFDLFYTRSELRQPHTLLESHPQLRDAFMQQARLIPEAFVPAASLARR